MESIRARVERLLESRGLTIKALARKRGWNNQTVINRLNKPREPRYEEFYRAIADELQMTVDQMFSETTYTRAAPTLLEVRESLVDILADLIEDPATPDTKRSDARRILKALIGNSPAS